MFFGLTPTDSLNLMIIMAAEHKANVIREIPVAITRQIAEAIIQSCSDLMVFPQVLIEKILLIKLIHYSEIAFESKVINCSRPFLLNVYTFLLH